MGHNNEPERTCIGCRTRRNASALVRLKVLHGKVVVDRHKPLSGRGAWLCPASKCLDRTLRSRGFQRAFRQDVFVPDRAALWSDICKQAKSQRRGQSEAVANDARDGGA